jgi:hypothetical protein
MISAVWTLVVSEAESFQTKFFASSFLAILSLVVE